MTKQKVTVIGAGGHASVVIATLHDAGYEVAGIIDDDNTKHGRQLMGVPIAGPDGMFSEGSLAIIAVGTNRVRKELASRFRGARWVTAIHPFAYVHPSVTLGEGTVVFAGSVLQPGTRVGDHSIVNTSVSVDHDCAVGDFTHLAPGTHVAGGVRIGEGAFIGVGSSVIPSVQIGEWVTVGAGATVLSDLADGVTAVGLPARPRSEGQD